MGCRRCIGLFVFCAVCIFFGRVPGAHSEVNNTLTLGATVTDGNSESAQGHALFVSEGERSGLGSLRAGIEGYYGESVLDGRSRKTVANARSFGNVRREFTPRMFGSLDGVALVDDIAGIDYRVAVSPGLGVYLFKDGRRALALETGPAYLWEKTGGIKADYFAWRVAERLTVALNEGVQLWQSCEYMPKADDLSVYILNGEAGIETRLNSRLGFRLVMQVRHDSTPADGQEKTDTMLLTGLTLRI